MRDKILIDFFEYEMVLEPMKAHEIYGYTYWDSLVIATAMLGNCGTLYSEDMQHNQFVQGKTRIVNPFVWMR